MEARILSYEDHDHDDTRDPQSWVLFALAGGVLPVGFAVSGYVRMWAFLDVFGGTSLISEVPLRAMLSPPLLALAPVMALIVVFVAVRHLRTSFPITADIVTKVAVVAVLAGGCALAVDHMVGARLLVQTHVVLLGLASLAALILGGILAEYAVAAWHRQARTWELLAVAAAAVLFIVFPFLVGRAAALESAWNPNRELPRILLKQDDSAYLLFANSNYLICAVGQRNRNSGWTKIGPFKSYAPPVSINLTASPRILCLSWTAVKEVSGISNYTTERDGGLW